MIKKNEPNNADELKKTRVRSIDRCHRRGKRGTTDAPGGKGDLPKKKSGLGGRFTKGKTIR